MNVELDLTVAYGAGPPPDRGLLRLAAETALRAAATDTDETLQLSVRVVGEAESAALNGRYRGRAYATNVLSFPAGAELPGLRVLGDLVVCGAVVEREARGRGQTSAARWAHMMVHGVLHLLGFDHIEEHEAEVMQALERRILAQLRYDDPYEHAG